MLFAAKLGVRQQNFDARVTKYLGDGFWGKGWQILVALSVNFRVWYFKISGILLMGIAIFVLMLWFF